jgi:hypothetical protein
MRIKKINSVTFGPFALAGLVIGFFASAAQAAEWTQYYTQEKPRLTNRYYDKTSISKTKENHIRVLGMGSTTAGSSTTLYQIDCKGSRIRDMNVKTYKKPMAEGKIGYQSNFPLSFKPLSEAAELDVHKAQLFKVICSPNS